MKNSAKKIISAILLASVFIVYSFVFTGCTEAITDTSSSSLEEKSQESQPGTQSNQIDVSDTSEYEASQVSVVSEVSESSVSISDIKNFKKLGLTSDNARYLLIKYFLEKDTSSLEKLCGLGAGTFDVYKKLELGKYTIKKTELWSGISFEFEVVSSKLDTLPAGKYTFYPVSDIIISFMIEPTEINKPSPAQDTLGLWLGIGGPFEIPDYNNLSGQAKDSYNRNVSDYILICYGDMNLEKFKTYAKDLFGIDDFIPSIKPIDGIYSMPAMGGTSWFYKKLSEKTADGITTLTLQYYADSAYTIKSHTIEYTLKNIGDDKFAIISSKYIYKSEFNPFAYGI